VHVEEAQSPASSRRAVESEAREGALLEALRGFACEATDAVGWTAAPLLRRTFERIAGPFAVGVALAYRLAQEGDRLALEESFGLGAAAQGRARVSTLAGTLCGSVVREATQIHAERSAMDADPRRLFAQDLSDYVGCPVRAANGEILGVLAFATARITPFDASERAVFGALADALGATWLRAAEARSRQAHAARLTAYLRHSERLSAVGALAGGIAHDFNNIISAIGTNAAVAKEYVGPTGVAGEDEADLRGCLDDVLGATHRAKALVRKLLVFSQEPAHTPSGQPTSLAQVVRDAVRWLPSTVPSGVKLRAHVPESDVPVLAQLSALHEMVVRLVIEAWRALPDPYLGSIELTVSVEPEGVRLVVTGANVDEVVVPAPPHASGHAGPELFALDELVRGQGGSMVVLAKRPSGSTVSILLPVSPG
jgi:signal transduction histidine kinase